MSYAKVIWPVKWQTVALTVIAVLIYILSTMLANGNVNLLYIILLLISMYFVYSAILYWWDKKETYTPIQKPNVNQGVCGGNCQFNKDLLPIMEPEFNLYECAKQIILLEDHCNNPGKRCEDCIKKHFMTIEALAEEGASIDKKGVHRDECNQLAEQVRRVKKDLVHGKDLGDIAQDLRKIRKPLMINYFDMADRIGEQMEIPDYG